MSTGPFLQVLFSSWFTDLFIQYWMNLTENAGCCQATFAFCFQFLLLAMHKQSGAVPDGLLWYQAQLHHTKLHLSAIHFSSDIVQCLHCIVCAERALLLTDECAVLHRTKMWLFITVAYLFQGSVSSEKLIRMKRDHVYPEAYMNIVSYSLELI